MSDKKNIVRNVTWNWAGMVFDAAAAFVVTPFLVHSLGDTTYGLWILVGSFSSYFGLLDLGVRASVGRFVAFHRAREDRAAVGATVSTSLAISSCAGLAVLACTAGVLWVFFRTFDVPPGQAAGVRTAIVLICVNLALTLPLNIFDGTLWAAQRFDLLNAVDIPISFLRVVLSFYLIGRGYGLVGLAELTLLITVVSGLAKAALTFHEYPGLSLGPAGVTRASAREITGYGLCTFVITVARMTRAQMSPFLIGSLMGLSLVTVYSVAKRLFDYAERAVWAATGVITPFATALHAREQYGRQRALFVEGGRVCMALALYFLIAFAFLGKPAITLWMGPKLSHAAVLLFILTAGETLPFSQSVTTSIVSGSGRMKFLTWAAVAELVIGLPMAAALARPLGLVGVCLALATAGLICRGLAVMVYGCILNEFPLARYIGHAMLPPLLLAAGPAALLSWAVRSQPPVTWGGFLAYAVAYSAVFPIFCLPLLDRERLLSLATAGRDRLTRRPVVEARADGSTGPPF